MYGNLNNRIIEAATRGQPAPEVGMGATITCYSDRHAATIVEVFNAAPKNALYVTVTEDDVKADPARAPHAMGHQDWLCTPNLNGRRSTFRWNEERGRWDEVMPKLDPRNPAKVRWVLNRSHDLGIGKRDHYHHWEF